jgi:hypothetical protein
VAPTTDVATQLQQLSKLKTAGALTDAEFEAARAELLGLADFRITDRWVFRSNEAKL